MLCAMHWLNEVILYVILPEKKEYLAYILLEHHPPYGSCVWALGLQLGLLLANVVGLLDDTASKDDGSNRN